MSLIFSNQFFMKFYKANFIYFESLFGKCTHSAYPECISKFPEAGSLIKLSKKDGSWALENVMSFFKNMFLFGPGVGQYVYIYKVSFVNDNSCHINRLRGKN